MKETFIIIALASNDVTNVCQLLQDFFHIFFYTHVPTCGTRLKISPRHVTPATGLRL
jgi:Na+-translocating ferredoxin:NAD+ oxidoreductase RnfC subunit